MSSRMDVFAGEKTIVTTSRGSGRITPERPHAQQQDRSARISDTVESRLAKLEREFAILKNNSPRDRSNWISKITGSFKGNSDFEEIVRLGKEMRDAEQPEED